MQGRVEFVLNIFEMQHTLRWINTNNFRVSKPQSNSHLRPCSRAIVHTDFTIFRPQFLEWNVSASNAEMHMSLIMQQILIRHNVRWLQGKGYRDRSCRIRAGVREHNQTVIHKRSHLGCHGGKS